MSLCSGYGGLDLAVRAVFPRARTVCYVEREVTAAAVLAARMDSGDLDAAPIWDDLRTFDARSWRGAVDLVVAGFPCQPVSLAGRRAGANDSRWLWPAVRDAFDGCGATALFLENVPGLVTKGLDEVVSDLAALGLAAEWGCYSAAEVGAPHRRNRWFCLAHAGRGGVDALEPVPVAKGGGAPEPGGAREDVADADGDGREGERGIWLLDVVGAALGDDADGRGGAAVGNSDGERQLEQDDAVRAEPRTSTRIHAGGTGGGPHEWPPARDDAAGWAAWDGPQPGVRRAPDGAPGRLDRLRVLGNGVVWQQAAHALRDLIARINTR